jgi:hypothetical protein
MLVAVAVTCDVLTSAGGNTVLDQIGLNRVDPSIQT